MLPVRFVVKYAQIRRTLVAKEETAVASIVPLVGLRTLAVRNVSRAVRGCLALGVKIVLWVLPDKGTTTMRRNANNVLWVKQHRQKVPPNAILAMLEHLAVAKVFVQTAQKVFTKTTKVKQHASIVHWEKSTSMVKRLVEVVV